MSNEELKPQQEEQQPLLVTRRAFLLDLGWLGLGLMFLGGAVNTLLRYVTPAKGVVHPREMKKVGSVRDLPEGQALKVTLGASNVLVVNVRGEISAFDRRCTHFGALVEWDSNTMTFRCRVHGGVFDSNGNVISGPPPRPLRQLKARVNREGSIFIGEA